MFTAFTKIKSYSVRLSVSTDTKSPEKYPFLDIGHISYSHPKDYLLLLETPVIRFQMLKSSVSISELDIHFPVTNSGINLPKIVKHLKGVTGNVQ